MGLGKIANPYSDTATKKALRADFRYNGWTLNLIRTGAQCWLRRANQRATVELFHGEDGDPIPAAQRLRQRLKDAGIWSHQDRRQKAE